MEKTESSYDVSKVSLFDMVLKLQLKGSVHTNDKITYFLTYLYWCLAVHIIFIDQNFEKSFAENNYNSKHQLILLASAQQAVNTP